MRPGLWFSRVFPGIVGILLACLPAVADVHVLSGRVDFVNRESRPVRVEARSELGVSLGDVLTDRDGRFRLEVTSLPVDLSVIPPRTSKGSWEREPERTRVLHASEEIELALYKNRHPAVRARLVDAAGVPLAGVPVVVRRLCGSVGESSISVVRTKPRGRFRANCSLECGVSFHAEGLGTVATLPPGECGNLGPVSP